ncbi:MAG: Mrp/NBP35 family ATP-binding protein [Selenomonadaceae bacterium]|nr:Mrp/NBP35 family ATP-binding protein [Selenomonadaceae bacterium]MBQ1915072.1 Mrp/NBP35 family ATP-binding protein [Selenomonadaceae bacterium]MBQ3970723.1 Mrp/NBP35 family ATP-binding protein [Selenomonadaceae bacterium]
MSENCNFDCSSCGETCDSRQEEAVDFRVPLNEKSKVHKVIAVVSGKGGVGKSMVTSLLAAGSSRAGFSTAVLDADITGPSIPQSFGLKELASGTKESIYAVRSKTGISVMSMNLLLENETDPVVWRGPILAGVVKQFWSEVEWGDIKYMFVDMPPGTGDVPLTVFQSLPIDGIVVVTSPQEMVGMIVEKAVKMAEMMEIPILALVENMSYFKCPDCGKVHDIFGKSHLEEIAEKYDIKTICRLPLDPAIADAADKGEIEFLKENELQPVMDIIQKLG